RTGLETVAAWIAAGERRGDDLRHEFPSFLLEAARPCQSPEIVGPGPTDRPRQLRFAGVVRGLRERPRAELLVQVAEICGGGKGRLLGIEPLVDPRVDTKTVAACRRRHELPETDRAGLRNGHRIEPALDHGRK